MKPRIFIYDGHWWVKVPGEFHERFAGKVSTFRLAQVVGFALEFAKAPFAVALMLVALGCGPYREPNQFNNMLSMGQVCVRLGGTPYMNSSEATGELICMFDMDGAQ